MNKPSKSKAETQSERRERLAKWYASIRSENGGRLKSNSIPFGSETDIIARMEAMQQRFGNHHNSRLCPTCGNERRLYPEGYECAYCNQFPSLLQSAENERRLQLEDRADWVQDGDPPALAGESEAEYNERTGRYERN